MRPDALRLGGGGEFSQLNWRPGGDCWRLLTTAAVDRQRHGVISVGRRPAAAGGEPRRRRVLASPTAAAAAVLAGDVATEPAARQHLLELDAESVVEPGVDERIVDGRAHGDQMSHEEHEHLIRPFGHLRTQTLITRMVQLPATAAIEYVADCCRTRTRTRTRTKTKTGTKTKIGTITKIVRGAYAHSPQVQYVYAPSGLSVPSIVA